MAYKIYGCAGIHLANPLHIDMDIDIAYVAYIATVAFIETMQYNEIRWRLYRVCRTYIYGGVHRADLPHRYGDVYIAHMVCISISRCP
jgi:hypothetical protein